MKRICTVIENTLTHVKIFTKLTNLKINHELDSIVVNKGLILRELGYFWGILWNLIKSDDELRWEIRDFDRFGKRTQKKNPWNKKSLDLEQDLWRNQTVTLVENFELKEREIWNKI